MAAAGEKDFDIRTHDLVDGTRTRLTFDDGNVDPRRSPDGQRIACHTVGCGSRPG